MGPHLRARNESEDVEQHDDDDDDDDDERAQRDASTEFWSMVSTSRAAKRGRLVSLKEFYFTTYYKCGLEGLVLIFVFHFER